MKRTQPSALIALGLAGLVVAFLLETAAAAGGSALFLPPVTLSIALMAIGIGVLALAWPIRQATRGTVPKHVNPFLAIRVALLAKASARSGALLLGGGLGFVLYILSRSVEPAVTSLWPAIGMAVGAAVLVTLGLVAEHFCTLPPDNDDQEQGEVRA